MNRRFDALILSCHSLECMLDEQVKMVDEQGKMVDEQNKMLDVLERRMDSCLRAMKENDRRERWRQRHNMGGTPGDPPARRFGQRWPDAVAAAQQCQGAGLLPRTVCHSAAYPCALLALPTRCASLHASCLPNPALLRCCGVQATTLEAPLRPTFANSQEPSQRSTASSLGAGTHC